MKNRTPLTSVTGLMAYPLAVYLNFILRGSDVCSINILIIRNVLVNRTFIKEGPYNMYPSTDLQNIVWIEIKAFCSKKEKKNSCLEGFVY